MVNICNKFIWFKRFGVDRLVQKGGGGGALGTFGCEYLFSFVYQLRNRKDLHLEAFFFSFFLFISSFQKALYGPSGSFTSPRPPSPEQKNFCIFLPVDRTERINHFMTIGNSFLNTIWKKCSFNTTPQSLAWDRTEWTYSHNFSQIRFRNEPSRRL